eukprot:1144881-Ditylum_brightwellii.AAC.1
MSIIQGHLVDRITKQGEGKYDRWVFAKFVGKNDQIMAVVTIYQPCKGTKKERITIHHQQVTLLQ